MLQRIETLLEEGVSFAIETTLATRSYRSLVKNAHKRGYTIQLLFFWLESPEVACKRVEKRVLEGGHDIPPNVIRRRYQSGLTNFLIYMHQLLTIGRFMIIILRQNS